MLRAASLLLGLPALVVVLVAANLGGGIGLVETLLAILVIIGFAIIASGWTIDHDT